ncbi:hypothetical protein QFC21_003620 [Naganishia friedmannii]|uniref:Uncharacterized protein n=1 Tax=Naganishia friedmannii TaxID=89922 RepID=A0ACC2VP73_9TREE|nr:hypothetical protein QFC21_003620 [Naganishia friedmannii]
MAPAATPTPFGTTPTAFLSQSSVAAAFATIHPSPSNSPLPVHFPFANVPVARWPEQYGLKKRESSSDAANDELYPTCAYQWLQACLAVTCASAEKWNSAYSYIQAYCSAFAVPLPSSSVKLLPTLVYGVAPQADPTATMAQDGSQPRPTVYYTRTATTITVDVIMGSICAALLAIAFATGAYNIRKLYKAEQTQSQLDSRPFAQAGTSMSHVKSYNNFEFDPTRTTGTGRSAFAVGPTTGGRRGHNLTHLDASAFNSVPAVTPRDDKIHVHTTTTINSMSSNPGGFPHGAGGGSGSGSNSSAGDHVPLSGDSTIHLNDEMSTLPVLKRYSAQAVKFVIDEEEDDDSDKDEKPKEKKFFSNRENRI